MEDQNQKSPAHPPTEDKGGPGIVAKMKGLVKRATDQKKRIRIILNPAAGQDKPVLSTFNTVFREANYDWDIAVTKESGDGQRLAIKAIGEGIDVVAVYGGDGSVMEVSCGMRNSQVPMAILPGGTGNVMSVELGIPADLETACRLIVGDHQIRKVDMGLVDDHCFLLRVGAGLEAAVIEGAPRPAKDRYGNLAYIISGIQAFQEPTPAQYHLIVDGEEVQTDGLGCIVANSGNLGVPGLNLSPDVSVDDGLLDVFIIRKVDLLNLIALTASVIRGLENKDQMLHFKARMVSVISTPPQSVQSDGELFGMTPISAKVLPQCLSVIVPSSP